MAKIFEMFNKRHFVNLVLSLFLHEPHLFADIFYDFSIFNNFKIVYYLYL